MLEFIKQKWVYHSLIWLLAIFVANFALLEANTDMEEKKVELLSLFLPAIILVYSIFLLKDYLIKRRRYVLFFTAAIICTVLMAFLANNMTAFLYNQEYDSSELKQWIVNMSFVVFIVVGLQYAKRGVIGEYQLQRLQAQNMAIELNTLKTQLHPHFLFNTLNNICGINQVNPEKGTNMLIELADLLRYHLELSKEERISLSKEIQLIGSFIELEKLRLRDNCSIKFVKPKKDTSLFIAPLLIFPFIENAFKHGTSSTSACFVDIQIEIKNMQLQLSVENSTIDHQKLVKTNIGQENTIRRLQMIYPQAHNIEIQETQKTYSVYLTIDL